MRFKRQAEKIHAYSSSYRVSEYTAYPETPIGIQVNGRRVRTDKGHLSALSSPQAANPCQWRGMPVI